jgi:hypothetical protein
MNSKKIFESLKNNLLEPKKQAVAKSLTPLLPTSELAELKEQIEDLKKEIECLKNKDAAEDKNATEED